METNLKMRREKYFPGIHKFEKLLRWLWSQFRSSCSDLEWKKPTTVNSQHVQEGYESFHMAVSDLEDTFHGLYIFRTRSQGLTALVSVSDGKIPITILILRRGPCLRWPPPPTTWTCSLPPSTWQPLWSPGWAPSTLPQLPRLAFGQNILKSLLTRSCLVLRSPPWATSSTTTCASPTTSMRLSI